MQVGESNNVRRVQRPDGVNGLQRGACRVGAGERNCLQHIHEERPQMDVARDQEGKAVEVFGLDECGRLRVGMLEVGLGNLREWPYPNIHALERIKRFRVRSTPRSIIQCSTGSPKMPEKASSLAWCSALA